MSRNILQYMVNLELALSQFLLEPQDLPLEELWQRQLLLLRKISPLEVPCSDLVELHQ